MGKEGVDAVGDICHKTFFPRVGGVQNRTFSYGFCSFGGVEDQGGYINSLVVYCNMHNRGGGKVHLAIKAFGAVLVHKIFFVLYHTSPIIELVFRFRNSFKMLGKSEFFTLSDGTPLYTQVLDSGHDVWVVVTHGVAEHSGRYQFLLELLGDHFNLLFYDLRGHGRSGGRRGYVEGFSCFYNDLGEIIRGFRKSHGMERFILFGHSMGATIACGYLQNQVGEEAYPEKVFLSCPGISLPPTDVFNVILGSLPSFALKRLVRMPFSLEMTKDNHFESFSHNPDVGRDYKNDEFNCQEVHTKLVFELLLAMKTIFSRPLRLKCPGFCAYAMEDKIVSPQAIKDYFEMVEHLVVLRGFEGSYHELHNETEEYHRQEYFQFLKSSLLGNSLDV